MRFHVGFSFRLKTLKKFLLPFLVGLLAYLGLGNILQVHAYENLNTDFRIYYEDYDFQSLSFGDYTFDEVWNLLTQENDNYYVVIFFQKWFIGGNANIGLNYNLIPKNQTTDVYYWARGSQSEFSSNAYTNISNLKPVNVISNSFDENQYNAINDCLVNNNCSSTYFYAPAMVSQTGTLFRIAPSSLTIYNNNSYSFSFPSDTINSTIDSQFVLYSNYKPFKYIYLGSGNNSSAVRYKNFYIEDTLLTDGSFIPTYCDIKDCSNFGGGGTPPYLEWFDEPQRIPRLYLSNIPKSDISTVDYSFYFDYFDDNFVNTLMFNTVYFGRVNHETYYSYEQINCTQTTEKIWDNDTDNSYQYHLYNISCSSSLTNYDQIFVYIEPLYDAYTNFNINYYYSTLSGGGHDNYYFGDENFLLVEHFENLPNDFNILLSTNFNLTRATFTSDNDYIFGAKVDRNNNKLSSLVANQVESFGTYDNTSLMFYNFKPQNNNSTNFVNIFFNRSTIISVGDNGTFTYYDSSNNITTGNIDNNYQNYTDNSYDLDYYFEQVNDFLRNINNDLYEVHNIFENVFYMIPSFFQVCIIVFYILLMTYLLFKFIRS